jgi:peptidoglycan/xylan/chitin deacetylase (PgdA/CDA1 family)
VYGSIRAAAPPWLRRRRTLRFATAIGAAILIVVGLTASPLVKAQAATSPVTVSLTFDDSNADQLPAEQTIKSLGLHGTFYTVSGWVNQPGYLTLANVQQIQADGNEIAGHTIEHPDLPTLALSEQEREICNDRVNLINWGFQPTDFAYPFADADTNEVYAKACGYNSARGLGDTVDPEGDCTGCVYAETTPPPDPYYLRAPDEVDSTWTLAQMEAQVTNAQSHKGGWVILTYHHICSDIGAADCPADLSTTPTIFDAFVTWLAGQASKGVTVKTVQQVIGGTFKPGVYINPPAPAAAGVNALTDPWLTSTDSTTGFPSCYQPGGWGTNTVAWASNTSVPPGAPTGSQSQNLTITGYSSGDAKLLPTMDQGACTPTVVPGDSYTVSVDYEATADTQFALYYRTTFGLWYYWTSSPYLAPASTWTTATFTTPAVPAGANGVSFGLALIANGTVTTDGYSFVLPASGGTAGVLAATALHSSAVSTAKGRQHVHSHIKLFIPGSGSLAARHSFPMPEWPGPHAKSPT